MRTTNHSGQNQPTATIYRFPVGGRSGLIARPADVVPADFNDYPAVDFGSGWYHDEAITEDKRKIEH